MNNHSDGATFIEAIRADIPGHPRLQDCIDDECMICGVRDCPVSDPLHYHHDGCPACWSAARAQLNAFQA